MFNFLKIFKRKKPDVAKGPIGFEDTGHGVARAFQRTNKVGERETIIMGEKYPLRGHSRESVLHGKLRMFTAPIKEGLKIIAACEKDMIPQENLKLPIRAFAEVCDMFIAAEESDNPRELGMKQKWQYAKKGGCYFLEEDDAYCFRWQLFMEAMFDRMKQIRLTKADKYFFHSRPDFDWELFEKLRRKKR